MCEAVQDGTRGVSSCEVVMEPSALEGGVSGRLIVCDGKGSAIDDRRKSTLSSLRLMAFWLVLTCLRRHLLYYDFQHGRRICNGHHQHLAETDLLHFRTIDTSQ